MMKRGIGVDDEEKTGQVGCEPDSRCGVAASLTVWNGFSWSRELPRGTDDLLATYHPVLQSTNRKLLMTIARLQIALRDERVTQSW